MLFNRAPDLAGLNFWLDSANLGTSTASMFSGMLRSSEAAARLTGTPADIVAKIFREAFGSTQVPAGDTPQQIAHWTERYTAATAADGTASADQRGLVLADLLAYMSKANNAGANVLNNRADAIRNYVVTQRGSDEKVAAELMQQAPSDRAGAIAKGTELGTLERNRLALIEMYVALFGRAPDQGGLVFWTDSMTKGVTIEQAAEGMLNSPEAMQTWLYPTAGLTPQQYNEQLVNRAYSLSLGRAPTADELAGWLSKLNAGTLGRGPFVAQFVNQVAKYTGTDAARIADRNLFVNKVSVSYTAVVTAGGVLPAGGSGAALLAGITSAATAQEAAEKALLAARTAVELAKNANNAAGIAAGATPLEDIRRTITRLYLTVLGRVPDKAGMDYYVPATAYTREQWNGVTLGFLNSTEAQGFLGDWKTMDKATFVRKLYLNALGTIPAGAVVQEEMNGYIARLNGGATNAEIAYEIATRMLTSQYLGTAELAAEAVLNNKTAVGLTAGLTLTLADTATQRAVLSLVTATDFTAALNYAYSGSQTALTNKLNQLRDTTTAAGTLADAMSAAATAETAARAANTTLQASPAAVYRLQLTQLYVALLGRSATNPPDAAGVQFYVNNNATLEQVVQSFLASPEGAPLFPASLGNAAFVDRVVAQVLGSASLIGASERAAWTAQLSATPAATRSKIALDIVNSVMNYATNGAVIAVGADYLTARGNLLQRVSDAFVKLDQATAAEVTRITNLRASLKASLDTLTAQLTPLQTAMNSADSARTSALSAATTAINNANATGDASAAKRLTIVRMYATLLQRKAGAGPTLADTNYYLNGKPEEIAQAFINSPEGRTYFPAGSSNAAFITQLYSTILGRSPIQSDIDYYSNVLVQNAANPNIRGLVAAGMIENFFVNYTDNTASQLTYKKAMDDKIAGFLTAINGTAATASSNASAVLTEATRLYNAIGTAQTAKTNAETAARNAQAGYTDGQAMLSLSRTAVEQVYAALRGTADYSGALFWIRGVATGPATINDVMNGILNGEYPADAAGFVGRLYQITLGRTGSTAEINYWAAQVPTNGRLYVAQQIMNSSEGKGVWGPKVATIDATLVARARADIKTKTDADAAVTTATTNLSTAQRNYDGYGWTVASATSARDAAAKVATTMANLVTAHRSVITADEKYLAYVNAKAAYDVKKAEWDPANAKYQAALAEPLAQYQAAAALGSTIRTASAAFATAAKALPAVVLNTTPAKVQAQQLTQLYFTLLNRAPTLSELYFAIDRMAERATMADIAATLLRSAEGLSRYPAAQTNDAFVRQLYTLGLNRTADTGGLKFYVDQLVAGVSRAELASRFIQSVNLANNSDTTTFANRAGTMLRTLGATTVTSAMVDAIIDAGAELARQKTVAFDAAAAAALAASPEAQRTTQLTRLYVTILNRTPDLGGLNFYANGMRNNASLTIDAVAQLILDSPEAQRLLPSSLSATAFVGKIFEMAMGRAATSAELTQYSAMLPANTRGKVVNAIINGVLNYKGTDRVQQATQLGFVAKMSLALNEVAGLASSDDTANQAAIALLDRVVKLGVKTHYMADAVVATANVQQGSQGIGGTNLITVDRWGNIVAMADQRDPNFRITYQYNYNNQLVSQSRNARAGDAVVSASTRYDALGRVVAQVDYNGNKNTTTYDSEGNVRREHHADGGIVTSSYNLFGNRLSVQQPDTVVNGAAAPGVLTKYSYDHLGNLKSTSIGTPVLVYVAVNTGQNDFEWKPTVSMQMAQSFVYDELGRQIRNTGTDGVSTVLEYDLDGNVIASATQATPGAGLLYRTVTLFDAQHQKVAMRDANNNTMTWTYDHGRMVSSVDMGKVETTYGHDQAGRLVTQKSGRGQDLRYTFTGANLTRIEDNATHLTTSYTYDANGNRLTEQQQYRGPLANLPSRVQNNTLRYDWQNRLVSIKDDVYTLTYKYDNNGNRTQITTQYGTTTLQSYNAYDAMNRQTVVNGDWVNGKAVFGERGHEITYDKSGNRLTDTFKGVKVGFTGTVYTATAGQTTTEYYTYDAAGRLESTKRDVLTIDVRRYDAAGRVTQSGLKDKVASGAGGGVGGAMAAAAAQASIAGTLKELGITSAGRIYSYDVGGHITRQKDLKADLGTAQDTYFVSDQWNPGGGYDAMGNLTGYTVVIPGTKRGSNGRYIIKYSLFDSYKEDSTTLATNNTTNISHYDVNGNRTSITKGVLETVLLDPGTVTENDGIMTVEGQRYEDRVRDLGEVVNRLWYDADGHIQSHTAGGQTEFNLIVNGQVYGEESQTADNILGSNYLGVTSASLAAAPSSYSVQSTNETLQGIAQSIWGDANLWYLIADANALGSDAKLAVGQVLRIPARVNTVHGDYGTYKPYDPSEQIGSTAPVMPEPKAGKGGCGGLGQIVMIVVAVVATIYTAGAAAGLMNVAVAGATSTFATGVGVLAGSAGFGAAALGAAAIGGAVGSIASQAVGIAAGIQDGFNWKGVALSALGAGVGAGVAAGASSLGSVFTGTGATAQMARAALGSAISQKVAVATGLQEHFDWRNVAASAAGAGVGAKLNANQTFQNAFSFSDLARGTVSGIATGTVASIVRGGKIDMVRIATDAFGNALADNLTAQMSASSAREQRLAAMDKQIDDVMADVLANGERFASTATDPRSKWPTIARGGSLSDNPDGADYPTGVLGEDEAYTKHMYAGPKGEAFPVIQTADGRVLAYPAATAATELVTGADIPQVIISGKLAREALLASDAAIATQSDSSSSSSLGSNAYDWLNDRRSTAVYVATGVYDATMRSTYMSTIHKASDAAVASIDQLGAGNTQQIRAIAEEVSNIRNVTRTATQAKLTPWGGYLSRAIEGKTPTFDQRYDARAAKLVRSGIAQPTEFQILRGVAEGAGKSNPTVTRLTTASRVLGPVAALGGMGMSGYEIYKAAPNDRLRVGVSEGAGMIGGLAGGVFGTTASVAALTGLAALTGVAAIASAPMLMIGALAVGGYAAYKGGDWGRTAGDYSYRLMSGN
ncbi:DUF4214 domain-containing protein [Pseudoduganella chitinolytica]|uniref:DUF4214 domain-containing protein n=2 Tax=Pseudoduganella chitinolytica TaxID=34070 RepID=A0ABY8BJ99_9BURK|nr:DUF4214 domain-containing protein [Pseudoduganella chitinolytica]